MVRVQGEEYTEAQARAEEMVTRLGCDCTSGIASLEGRAQELSAAVER